jgi:hypothetical protein
MLTRISLIVVGLVSVYILVILSGYFQLAVPSRIPSFTLDLPIGERKIILLIGAGFIGLRWFFVHRNRSDHDAAGSRSR